MENHLMMFCAKIVLNKIMNKTKNMIKDSLQNTDKGFYLLKETFKFENLFQDFCQKYYINIFKNLKKFYPILIFNSGI